MKIFLNHYMLYISILLQKMIVYDCLILLFSFLLDFLQFVSSLPLQLICKFTQSFFLVNNRGSISFVVSLSIPIITVYFSTIKKSAVHQRNTLLGIFLFFELDLNDPIWMRFIKSDSVNFTNSTYLISDIVFYRGKILLIIHLS